MPKSWLNPDETRVALGCMRLSTERDRDDARALATIRAALDAGVTIFDTARAYALSDDELGHNERLLGRALKGSAVRVITKGGMTRPGGRWLPDGRAKSILADCEASLVALDGIPIDLYLLHAPDPNVPFATSVRALVSLLDKKLVRQIGLSNVNRAQLDEALAIAPICAVQIQLGYFDDSALRNGVVARCIEQDVAVLAHRPLGGVKKQRTIARDQALCAVAARYRTTPNNVALSAVLDLHPSIVAVAGATKPSSICAAAVALDDADRALLRPRLDREAVHGPKAPSDLVDGEVVLLMGIQGAGKTDALSSWLARGYERLNRDELGGTMKQLHRRLGERLAAGARRVVLDNTYVTRAFRRDAIDAAWKYRLPVRGVWFETPLHNAQVNVVLRMLEAHGRLLMPEEMFRLDSPTALPPHAQHRTARIMEKPSLDEGFFALDVVPFVRRPSPHPKGARFIALEALVDPNGDPRDQLSRALGIDDVARFVFSWSANMRVSLDAAAQRVRAAAPHVALTFAECPHPAGPPMCWCRPPLPGLLLAFAVANGIDPAKSVVVGTGPAHKTMATALGAEFASP